jgi:type IV pilus assembly protein PilP
MMMVLRPLKFAAVFSCLLLVGCGSTDLSDLRKFTANAYKDRKPQVDPLPVFEPHKGFTYTSSDQTDPFNKTNLKPVRSLSASKKGVNAPDLNRRKEPLEDYPLDSLQMVGTMGHENLTWLIIQAPDGTVHHVREGNFVGQAYGKIISISDEKAVVVEKILDPNGNWQDREATLAVTN